MCNLLGCGARGRGGLEQIHLLRPPAPDRLFVPQKTQRRAIGPS